MLAELTFAIMLRNTKTVGLTNPYGVGEEMNELPRSIQRHRGLP